MLILRGTLLSFNYRYHFPALQYFAFSMANIDNIANIRKPYHNESNVFLETDLISKDPIKQFTSWFEEACNTPSIKEPNAMTLATVHKNGKPSARMVLLKGYGHEGFNFYTNYRSVKARDLEETPFAALVFYWGEITRSIRIEGKVEKLPLTAADNYFSSRPRSSQIAAHVSMNQSAPIASRDILKERETTIDHKFKNKPVTRPSFWGGYVVKPDMIEFWQGQSNRMHDRIVFRKKVDDSKEMFNEGENGWVYQRLEP